jgi:DNA-binding NarL/FixJ family response regulator
VFAAPPPLRVLLVDDDPAFTELMKCVLSLNGVDVLGEAPDGAEGVELALELEPDVVVMDVRMPRMDGLEATRRILATVPGTRVLVVSSSTDPDDVERAREAGADGYLPKERAAAELPDWLEALRPLPPSPKLRPVGQRLWGWKALELSGY